MDEDDGEEHLAAEAVEHLVGRDAGLFGEYRDELSDFFADTDPFRDTGWRDGFHRRCCLGLRVGNLFDDVRPLLVVETG